MDMIAQNSNIEKSLRIRNILILVVIVMMISNVMLSYIILRSDRQTIIMPGFISKEYVLSRNDISSSYLEDMARDIIITMLSMTANNSKYIEETILKLVDPDVYGKVAQQLYDLSADIKQRQVTLAFYPIDISVSSKKLTAQVEGDLLTFVGNQKTNVERKKYSLHFTYSGAKLLLREFYEEKPEEKNINPIKGDQK
jgi:conjugal transfer pilus assembly protein TraE